MSSHGHSQQAAQPPKFSRYRSVRKAASARNDQDEWASGACGSGGPPPPLPQDPTPAKTQESIKRSMSRYRKARPDASKAVASAPPLPPQPPVSIKENRPYTHGSDHDNLDAGNYNSTSEREVLGRELQIPVPGLKKDLPFRDCPTKKASQPSNPLQTLERPSAGKDICEGTVTSRKGTNDHQVTETTWSSFHNSSQPQGNYNGRVDDGGAHVSLMYHEYPRRSQLLTQDELDANARAAATHSNQQSARSKKPQKEKSGSGSGLLSRLKGLDSGSVTRDKDGTRGNLKNMISAPQPVDPSGVDKVPADDTPISAVNASERRVLVICNESFIRLPVTPTTDVREILYSAASSLDEDILPHASTVTEYFKQLGLERPLRKYERVRGVMNSWDSDSYNHLIVAPRSDDSDEETDELVEARYAPREQPSEKSFQLYYSQRPGKWDKRLITLKSDGQVSMMKKEGAESTNICHMSDFDVYLPTRRELKRLKAPKRFCYAVKSQQKSSVFLTNENFVHYFSTGEKDVALGWYMSMQQWRSWYLVNMLGEGDSNNEKRDSKTQGHNKGIYTDSTTADKKITAPRAMQGHQRSPDPYKADSVRLSLHVDTSAPDRQASDGRVPKDSSSAVRSKSAKRAPPLRQMPTQDVKSYPSSPTSPVPFSGDFTSDFGNTHAGPRKKNRKEPQPGPSSQETSGEEPFASSGLLGRTYTKRQNAMREREKEAADREDLFSKGGLLRNSSPPPLPKQQSDHYGNYNYNPPQVRPRNDSSAKGTTRTSLERTSTRRRQEQPKPLVDLTPTYMEPPQHGRKGRGIAVEPGTLLVDNVTGPELEPGAIAVPSATTWRRPVQQRSGTISYDAAGQQRNLVGGGGGARQRSDTFRSQRQVPPSHHQQQVNMRIPAGRTSVDVHSTPVSPTESPFAPTGLVARSARANTTQGAVPTGRGVATGNRNVVGRPLLDISEPSQFADGSLLRAVEQQHGSGDNGPVG